MDSYQQPGSSVIDPPPPPPGIFGTRIPSSVAFTVGVLLFLLPFAELKCKAADEAQIAIFSRNNNSLSFTNTGLGLALGNEWKLKMPGMGNQKRNLNTNNIDSTEPNTYAIIALVLAILGLGLSFINTKSSAVINIVTGLLSAIALIGLMIDLKKEVNESLSEKAGGGFDIANKYLPSLVFTPWFYIAVIAFLVAAFFSYRRMQSLT